MDDSKIIDLYWERSEQAIAETDQKYGKYCYRIAYNILASKEDAEESVSDTYMTAWSAIPPRRPSVLATFLGKITRHISIDRWRTRNAYKRGGVSPPANPSNSNTPSVMTDGVLSYHLSLHKRITFV